MEDNPRECHSKLDFVLWADRIWVKESIKTSLYITIWEESNLTNTFIDFGTIDSYRR